MKYKYLSILSLVILTVLLGYFLVIRGGLLKNSGTGIDEGRCLNASEKSVFSIVTKGTPALVRVSVVSDGGSTLWSKDIEIPNSNAFNPVSLTQCYFYTEEATNFDYKSQTFMAGYKRTIEQYRWFSNDPSRELAVLEENRTGKDSDFKAYYARSSFVVDPSGKYIALVRSYLSQDDYALVIKDIVTSKDIYALTMNDIVKDHPKAVGSFSIGEWVERPDGVYLTGDIFDTSRWTAFYYIKRDMWETKIYTTPDDYQWGVERAAPPFTPYLAYTDIIIWTGIPDVDDQLLQEQIAEGKQKHLIVADLKTGQEKTIETVPIVKGHRFDLKWLSDTELQYELPSGEKRIYKLDEK